MQRIEELTRYPSPATRPHPLTFFHGLLWMGSWDTDRIYAIDPKTWSIGEEILAPGKPYGITAYGDELRVVVAHGEEDDRYLYRLSPGKGFDPQSKTPCPDLTGSYLAAENSSLYLGQMTFRRILVLDAGANVKRELPLPTRCAGIGFGADGGFYMISGDMELEHLKFGTLDITQAAPPFTEIRPLPDEARSLAFDGDRWWTSLRDTNEIASFRI
jgi:hypothetical protein